MAEKQHSFVAVETVPSNRQRGRKMILLGETVTGSTEKLGALVEAGYLVPSEMVKDPAAMVAEKSYGLKKGREAGLRSREPKTRQV
jgi:hypothetical protein